MNETASASTGSYQSTPAQLLMDLTGSHEEATNKAFSGLNEDKPAPSGLETEVDPNNIWHPQQLRRQRPSMAQLNDAVRQLTAFRPAPPPHQPPILTPFATMRANILITETMIRFVLAEYRELLESAAKQLSTSTGQASSQSSEGAVKVENGSLDWETATEDMINSLQSMSLESLAANGQVSSVRAPLLGIHKLILFDSQ